MSKDPRGPMRTWVSIEKTSSKTLVMLECGHVARFNPIYDYSLDPQHHCFQCGPYGDNATNLQF